MEILGDQIAEKKLRGENGEERDPEFLAQRKPGDGVDHGGAAGEKYIDNAIC